MNGPDLSFLAARASVLEDRTTERLVDVHTRIEQARRRRSVGVAMGFAGLAVALIIGLVLVQSDQGQKNPSPAPTPAPRSAPDVGTCSAVPNMTDDIDADPDNWYDDSTEVPCTEPHNAENVTTYFLDDPSPEEADKWIDNCEDAVTRYLGIDENHWLPWSSGMALPTLEQIAQGAHWVQCAALIPADLNGNALQTLTDSVEGVATHPPVELWACTSERPTYTNQQRVPCDKPHAYEQTGGLTRTDEEAIYPSPAKRADAVMETCPATVPAGHDGVAVTALWDPRSALKPGRPIWGACFMFNSNGTLLPAR